LLVVGCLLFVEQLYIEKVNVGWVSWAKPNLRWNKLKLILSFYWIC